MGSIKLDTMPEDILTHILLYGITDDFETKNYEYTELFLLVISHTNQALRRFALSTPCLWSTLYIDTCCNKISRGDDGLLNLFRLWIERSGDSPLDYKIITSNRVNPIIDDILKLFFREKRRWKSVTLEFREYVPHLSFKPTDMPCLQNFELVSLYDYVPVEKIIHLSKSTQLGRLYLSQVKIAQWRTIMKTIHTQQLTELRLGLATRGLAVVDPYLLKSLGMFTNLKRLKFDLYHKNEFGDLVMSGPPVLLPNLTMLVLGLYCRNLMKYLITPSLISLSIISRGDEGSWIVNYLRRSRPPLEIMHLEIYYLEMDDLRFVLQEVPNLKTLSLIRGYHRRGPYNIWPLLRVDDPSLDILVPKLTDLLYKISGHWEGSASEEVLLLVDAIESRKRYIRNFHFHFFYHAHIFSRDTRVILGTVNEPDAKDAHKHLVEMFRFSG